MNTNLKCKDALHLLQLEDKLEYSITSNNESLEKNCTPKYNYMAVYKLVLNFYDPANYI